MLGLCRRTEKLEGTLEVSGSKNAALPILSACLLTDEKCVIRNVPDLEDVRVLFALLRKMGKTIKFEKNIAQVSGHLRSGSLPEKLVRKLRASVLVMGPVLARLGEGSFALPGGCALGERPIDIHLSGLKAMGASYSILRGRMIFRRQALKGAHIKFSFPSVGATENLLMASSCAGGVTVIENASVEPEIGDLCLFLRAMGAEITRKGSSYTVKGRACLGGADFTVMPDRIEAGTFLLAAASVGGRVRVDSACPAHLGALLTKLRATGVKISKKGNSLTVHSPKIIKPVNIVTGPYPAFPTDLQPLWAVYMLRASGRSSIKDRIFPARFMYVDELKRLGASMVLKNAVLMINRSRLSGTNIYACDLRAAAAMIIAGLMAEGETRVYELRHLFRGYENFFIKLRKLGANVSMEQLKEEK
ncbi:MAG: UDP-N-acetylglucosamine 1-carboxyvinyltransferase [Candidatus Omnitrophota bacterium]|nr:UDP-N-acetylglucosamine 1-carboxyvinyltransferase [Candidatus Omnitrophota bacterium]MBU3929330.1 UDP-N-acetylglucosamine 1-carboxyvinyltransferase [bacterium]MBU4122445.1 UDP-N-acetylglucosamine 1-carboxyvinyltransferase [bacterium]